MTPVGGAERWGLERIGAYAAGELEGRGGPRGGAAHLRQARVPAPRRVLRQDARHALHSGRGVEAPEVLVGYAIRRAYMSAFLRQAETFLGALGRSYLDALVYYFGLRAVRRESYGGGI